MSFDKFDDLLFPEEETTSVGIFGSLGSGEWGSFFLYFALFHVVRQILILTGLVDTARVIEGAGYPLYPITFLLKVALLGLLYMLCRSLPSGAPRNICRLLVVDVISLFVYWYLDSAKLGYEGMILSALMSVILTFAIPVLWVLVGRRVEFPLARRVFYFSSGIIPLLLFSIVFLQKPAITLLLIRPEDTWFIELFYNVAGMTFFGLWSIVSVTVSLMAVTVNLDDFRSPSIPRFPALSLGVSIFTLWLFPLQFAYIADLYVPLAWWGVVFGGFSLVFLAISSLSLVRSSSVLYSLSLFAHAVWILVRGWDFRSLVFDPTSVSDAQISDLFTFLIVSHLLFWVILIFLSPWRPLTLSMPYAFLLFLSLIFFSGFPFQSRGEFFLLFYLGFFGLPSGYVVGYFFFPLSRKSVSLKAV